MSQRRRSSRSSVTALLLTALSPGCRATPSQQLGTGAATNAVAPAATPSAERPRTDAPIWLAISTPSLAGALQPLAEQRRADGFEVVIASAAPAEALTNLSRRPAFILLVGDELPPGDGRPASASASATWRVASPWRTLYRWRAVQREQFAADALWGDVDGDLLPEIPVGRIPVRTPAQLQLVVAKTLAYESAPPTVADLRLPVWAGSAGYDPLMDALSTSLLLSTIEQSSPSWVEPVVTVGDPASPYCGWPPSQAEGFSRELRRGGLLAALVGHSGTTFFHSMDFQGRSIDFSAAAAESLLASGPPAPPTVLLTCEAGNFTVETRSLAEALLSSPGGPVAVIGATTESHPLTNYHSSVALLEGLARHPQRLGQLWLASQREARSGHSLLLDGRLAGLEGSLEGPIDTEQLRRDQPLMYALLGDPALRLRLPQRLEARVQRQADGWHWQADKPPTASKILVQRSASVAPPPAVVLDQVDERQAQQAYRQANAIFAFVEQEALSAAVPWRGVITQPGLVRLVAVADRALHVATLDLR